MTAKEQRLQAGKRTMKALEQLSRALDSEESTIGNGRGSRMPKNKIRRSRSSLQVLRMNLAKRLASYGGDKLADDVFPGHEHYS